MEHFISFYCPIHLLTFLAAAATQQFLFVSLLHNSFTPLHHNSAFSSFPCLFAHQLEQLICRNQATLIFFPNSRTKKNTKKCMSLGERYRAKGCMWGVCTSQGVCEKGKERETEHEREGGRDGSIVCEWMVVRWGRTLSLQSQSVEGRTQRTGCGSVCAPSSPLCFSAWMTFRLIGTLACLGPPDDFRCRLGPGTSAGFVGRLIHAVKTTLDLPQAASQWAKTLERWGWRSSSCSSSSPLG